MAPTITRKNIMLTIISLAVVLLVYVAYDTLHFRLKSTTPSLSQVATSTVEIKYHFSQPIKSVKKVTLNERDITSDITIDTRTITIPFNELLDSDTTYTITLTSVQSNWFGNNIESIERSFTPEYIEFNNLPEEDRQTQIDASNSGQVDDPFINDNVFPIFNERWQLEANVITSDRSVVLVVKFFEEVPDYDNNAEVKQLPDSTAEQYRKEVLKEIEKRGGDPDEYTIIYETNKYLYNKYNHSDNTHN